MRRILVILFLIIYGLLIIPACRLGRDCGLIYAGDPIEKLGRGITNIGTGWVEIPKQIRRSTEESGDMAGVVVGPLKGIAKAIGRTLAGIYEVVTFLIPLPRRYEPLIEPEYVFVSEPTN